MSLVNVPFSGIMHRGLSKALLSRRMKRKKENSLRSSSACDSIQFHVMRPSCHYMWCTTAEVEDDDSLRFKARIAPHGYEDFDSKSLSSDCCMCSPTGIRVLATTDTIRRWRLLKIDVEMAFHQSGAQMARYK